MSVFARRFITTREKKILGWAIGIKKKGRHLSIIEAKFILKSPKIQKTKSGFYFIINCSFIISGKCIVTANFQFGYLEHLLNSTFSV